MIKQITSSSSTEDRRLLLWLSTSGVVISIISLIINYQINIGLPIIIVTYFGIFTYSILYFIIRKGLNIIASQYLIVYITLVFTNVLWYFEYSYEGPVLYFFIVIFTLIIFIWHGRRLFTGSLILVINIGVCFAIDYYYMDFVPGYQDEVTRIIDIYTSLIMYGIIMYALMHAVKKSYAREYKKALQSDKLKTAFLENVSHEIRTPLNAIIGFSNLLDSDDISKEQHKEYITLINDSNDTLLRVIDDILQVSIIEADQLTLNIADCNINQLLNGLFSMYNQALIKRKKDDVKLNVSEFESNVIVKTDKIRLQQILINLLDNAIKFTHSGTIKFGYQVEESSILFRITDTGIGIKNKHQSKIFDRFYKVEDDKEELYRGTGIGLFLTKRIVESLGGDIWVKSSYGDGATFCFTLPKTGYYEIEDNPEKDVIVEELNPLEGKKILVVEDQPSSQIYFKNILKKSGIEVLQAWDGVEGVELAKLHTDIDLILMDLRLPIVSGYEALEEIRKFNSDIPIIAQTAFGMKQDEKACIDAGFNDYISKPVKSDLLFEKIWNALK